VADKAELEKLDLNGRLWGEPQLSSEPGPSLSSLTLLSFLDQAMPSEKRAVSSFRR
jgi:hypothetical protein